MIWALVTMRALPMFAERVMPETARKVASTFLNNNGAKSSQLTDLTKEAGFTNLYIFAAEQGFVVMAADDCVQPILGYSLTGKFVAENMPTNVSGWLQGYNDEIQYAIESRVKATAETSKLWKELIDGNSKAAKATIIVDALIQTTWDQDPGYNDLCPYDNNAGELTVTGCVATAMAQIMRYWEYPSHGVGSHSYTPTSHSEYGVQSVNFAQATYDWTAMPLHSSSDEIAKLMYHCGVSVDMMYDIANNGGSGAYSDDIPNALTTYFNYKSGVYYKAKSSYNNNNWLTLIKTELNAGRPVEYNGSGSGGGHAFVCDGYDNSDYFHFNWGWSGANDGFYSLSNLVPGSGGSGGGSYSFTKNQSAVIGIQPKDCTASAPTDLAITLEGRTAILTWNLANNAVSYSIYRDGSLIANTTNTTYSDIDLSYGTYAYYVKGVDSNGAKSSPTSTINITIEPVPSQLTVTKQNNNAILSWTEPEWCTPQNDDEVLTYSYGNTIYSFGSGGTMQLYYGHKYPASMINTNKVLYKVSFYPTLAGTFSLHVYTASAGNSKPQTQVYTQDITVSGTGWNDIVLNTPLQLDASEDLWVFIYDPEGKDYPMGAGEYVGTDSNGNYVSTSTPTSSVSVQQVVMLINTYITDGAFAYNLYDGTTTVASNISNTTYTVNNIANNTAHQYTLKTNFNGGLTEASNMAGLTLGTASLASLTMTANDKMTITEDSQLTVTGTLSDENADNLILENGAQLIHNTSGVKATLHKTISAYSESSGWNFIASPMTSLTVDNTAHTNIASNDFDLYRFNQSPSLTTTDEKTGYFEWENWKTQESDHYHFNLEHGNGYLYAHNPGIDAVFIGELADPQNGEVQVRYSTDNPDSKMHGWNLIGNPFPCNAYINRSYYKINDEGNGIQVVENNAAILPCSGIMIKTENTNGETVTFTKDPQTNGAKGSLNIALAKYGTRDNAILDNAIVTFNKDNELSKFYFGHSNANIYFPKNEGEYAIAYSQSMGEMPLNFIANEDGYYCLNISSEVVNFTYLHLIDNMTGTDVDLLQTPSYCFNASTTDYTSRFKLLFIGNDASIDSMANDTFAFFSNGSWIINNTGQATVQVIDLAGRILNSEHIEGCCNISFNVAPGIYLLRLINGNSLQTQKIIIK